MTREPQLCGPYWLHNCLVNVCVQTWVKQVGRLVYRPGALRVDPVSILTHPCVNKYISYVYQWRPYHTFSQERSTDGARSVATNQLVHRHVTCVYLLHPLLRGYIMMRNVYTLRRMRIHGLRSGAVPRAWPAHLVPPCPRSASLDSSALSVFAETGVSWFKIDGAG